MKIQSTYGPNEVPGSDSVLTDRRIFDGILRPLKTVMCPHPIHIHQTECSNFTSKTPEKNSKNDNKNDKNENKNKNESMLSPYDILHVLNSLAVVRYDDVRTDIIAGLLELMQVSGSGSVCVTVWRDCMSVCVSVTVCVCETNSVCVWQ